jgi:hypothetical protein
MDEAQANRKKRRSTIGIGWERINIDDPERDKQILTNNIMKELCQMDNAAERSGRNKEFKIEDFKTIAAFDERYVKIFLKWFEGEKSYLQISPDGRISLTDLGRNHCRDFDIRDA